MALAASVTLPPATVVPVVSPRDTARPSSAAPVAIVMSPSARMLPTNVAPAPMVVSASGVAARPSPTCQKTSEPPQVSGATMGATTDAPGATVSAPSIWKIHGPAPVSVSVPVSGASPSKQ